MAESAPPVHPQVPGFLRGLVIALLIGGAGLAIWSLALKEETEPRDALRLLEAGDINAAAGEIDLILNQADGLLAANRAGEARKAFIRARDLASTVRDRILADRIRQLKREEAGTPPSKEIDPLLARMRPEYQFSIRVADACYALAGMAMARIREAHADEFASAAASPHQRFVPPSAETEPVREEILRGLAANPEHARLLRLQGVLDNLTGRFGSAEKALRRALELDDRFAEAYNDLGLVYINRHQFDKAGQCFKNALLAANGKPGVEATACFNLGMFHADRCIAKAGGGEEAAAAERAEAIRNLRSFLAMPGVSGPDAERARKTLGEIEKLR